MNSIIVCSLRKNADQPPVGYSLLRVDRRNPILGNTHEMVKNNLVERNRVISNFRKDLDIDRKKNGKMWHEIEKVADRVASGEKIALQCWCSPKPCHADIIKSAVIFVLKQRRHPIMGQVNLNI